MVAMSVATLGSMHAVQINHLRHHRYCMEPEDVEAASARMSWWHAIMIGPVFPLRLVFKAAMIGNRRIRDWIALELAANIVWIALVFGAFDCGFLKYHIVAMAIGQCLTSFFAVWTVHHDAEGSLAMSRTVRRKFFARVTYNMFFHMEHHLFPAVPTCHLATLAARIDAAGASIQWRQVL